MGSGQCNVKAYNRRDLAALKLANGRSAEAFWFLSPELDGDEAPDAAEHFDARDAGWTKVALEPMARHRGEEQAAAA